MSFHILLLSLLLGLGTTAVDKPLAGDWSGSFTRDGNMFSCQLSVHIDQAGNKLSGQVRYEWPNYHFVTWSFSGSLYGTDSITLDEIPRPDTTSLSATEIAHWSPRRLTGKLITGINSFAITGTWTNAAGTTDTARTYSQPGTSRKGTFSLRRSETAVELLSDYVTAHMMDWKTQHPDISANSTVAAMQDAFATEFCKNCFRIHGATLVYNAAAAQYQLSIDGCASFNIQVPGIEADIFKKGCNDLSLNRNLLVHLAAPGQIAVVTCFQFTTKSNTVFPAKTYKYGNCP